MLMKNIWRLSGLSLGRHWVKMDISERTYILVRCLKNRKRRTLVQTRGSKALNFEEALVII